MKKKIVVLGIAFIMLFSVVGLSGCANCPCVKECQYSGKTTQVFESDFVLTLSINQTCIQVSNTIKVTAEFKNLSGEDVSIMVCTDFIPHYDVCETSAGVEYNEMLKIGIFSDEIMWTGFRRPWLSRQEILGKNNSIVRAREFTIQDHTNLQVQAVISFAWNDELFSMKSKPINIFVRR